MSRIISSLLMFIASVSTVLIGLYNESAKQHLGWTITVYVILALGATVLGWSDPIGKLVRRGSARKILLNASRGYLERVERHIPGIPEPVDREEAEKLAGFLGHDLSAVLVGEAGTGKSGIIKEVAERGVSGRSLVVLDARAFLDCRSIEDISLRLGIKGISLIDVLTQWGTGAVLVIDQLDSVWRAEVRQVFLNLVKACGGEGKLGIVLVMRPNEADGVLDFLRENPAISGYKILSKELPSEKAVELLGVLGIPDPPEELVGLARNLLNLSIIADLIRKGDVESVALIEGQLALWEAFRKSLIKREGNDDSLGGKVLGRAMDLALECLLDPHDTCEVGLDVAWADDRLISSRILVPSRGNRYQFWHDHFRDYLVAWYAVHIKGWSLPQIKQEIGAAKAGLVLTWVWQIENELDADRAEQFFEEAMGNG